MKKLVICSLIGLSSLTAFAQGSCSSEIVEAAKSADGCVYDAIVTIHGNSVEVKCPLYIPGNPAAHTPYLAKDYSFSVSNTCAVTLEPLE